MPLDDVPPCTIVRPLHVLSHSQARPRRVTLEAGEVKTHLPICPVRVGLYCSLGGPAWVIKWHGETSVFQELLCGKSETKDLALVMTAQQKRSRRGQWCPTAGSCNNTMYVDFENEDKDDAVAR